MANQQTVVVYRSLWEQQQDQFWMKFMDQHPDLMMWLSGGFLLFFAIFFLSVLVSIIKEHIQMNRSFKNFGKRWP